ncbi:TonB-dependent receptor domain-containing protein [Hyphobacterium sp.]|uniref:TonB-dependent receptor domain-containing protein n=1 Tax=Hyphobacterium sp. TaxID=2004662 RepID=UPI003BAB2872
MRALRYGVCLVALTSGVAAAQQQNEVADTIVVTSSPIGVYADEVVGSVDVVDADHIEENLAGTIADTIAHEPGVTTTFFGPASSRPVIRGQGAERVRILVNGIGSLDASSSSPDHAVSSEALEAQQVEILRGPAAIAYGGGAVGGVVNIIDGRVPDSHPENGVESRFYVGATSVDDGHQFAARSRFSVGNFVFHVEGLQRASEVYEIPGYAESALQRAMEEDHHDDDDHDDLGVSIAFDDDDHDDDDHDHEEEEEAFGFVPDSDLEFSSGSAGVSFISDWGFIGVAYRTSDGEYGLPGHSHGHGHEDEDHDDDDHDDHDDLGVSIGFDDDDHDDDDHGDEHGEEESARLVVTQNRWDVRGNAEFAGAPIEQVRFSLGIGDYRHVELEGGSVGTEFTNDSWEGRVELRHRPIGDVEGAFGLQTSNRDFAAIGAEAYIQPVETRDVGLFTVQRLDNGDWGVEGGARFESREVETATQSRSFDTFSLSGAVFTRPQDGLFLAVTGALTERAPTDIELFANGPHLATQAFEVGNANLDAERAASLDFTARWEDSVWSAEGAVFFAAYDGFIGLFPTGGEQDELPVFNYAQSDANLWGFEGRVGRELGAVEDWIFRGELTAEYVRGELDSGGNLPRIPPLGVSALVEAERGMFTANLEVAWTAEQDEVANFELPTDSFTLVNTRLVVRPVEGRDVRLILEARNITDEEARLHTSFLKDLLPLPGRNFRAALSVGF